MLLFLLFFFPQAGTEVNDAIFDSRVKVRVKARRIGGSQSGFVRLWFRSIGCSPYISSRVKAFLETSKQTSKINSILDCL